MPARPDPPRRETPAPHDSFAAEVHGQPLLTRAEERQLAYRVAEGDPEARDRLVRANLRLVAAIARDYVGRGLDVCDLIAEGNLGLLRAAEGFDPSMNTRFGTYAGFWVRQSMKRALVNTGKTIRVPAYIAQLLNEWRRTAVALKDELGREASEAEVGARLGLSPRRLALVQEALRTQAVAAPGGAGEEGIDPAALLADSAAARPDAEAEGKEELARMLELIGRLGDREASLLRLRFGLGGGTPMTCADIGCRLGLTRERVRQLERQSLGRLREWMEGASRETAARDPRAGRFPVG